MWESQKRPKLLHYRWNTDRCVEEARRGTSKSERYGTINTPAYITLLQLQSASPPVIKQSA
jgi:hypothetical protein